MPCTPFCVTPIIKEIEIFVESFSWGMKNLWPMWRVASTAASRLLLKTRLSWYFSVLCGIFSSTTYVGSTVYFTVVCYTCPVRLHSHDNVLMIIFLQFKYFRYRPRCIVYICHIFVLSSNVMSGLICCQLSGLIQSNVCNFNLL